MRWLKQILIFFLVFLLVAGGGFYTAFRIMNAKTGPDTYAHYQTQDTVPHGKVGIFVTRLIMPETMEDEFFINISDKIRAQVIPWPANLLAARDRGLVLLDAVKFYERDAFTPTRLIDARGRDVDENGVSWMDHYRRGEILFVPARADDAQDHGYFLHTKVKGGMPTATGKLMAKARVWYCGAGIAQGRIPHEAGTLAFIETALAQMRAKYGDIPTEIANALYPQEMKSGLSRLLDSGVETLIVSAPMAIYSGFEEFNSSFAKTFKYVDEWKAANPNRRVQIIIAPPMGQFEELGQAYLAMLKDRLETLPREASVKVAITTHGMPWRQFPNEPWLTFAPAYLDDLQVRAEALVAGYGFARTAVVRAQDIGAETKTDPENAYLSTNEAIKQGIAEAYDYVVTLPVEFFAENTDTLMAHALYKFNGVGDYSVYQPIDYADWSVPFSRTFQAGSTIVIYNGVPVGTYARHVSEALFLSLDGILAKSAAAPDAVSSVAE
jgi:protoheme ferro-lyase